MERVSMLEEYAELVLAGEEPMARKTATPLAGYDVALERQKLESQVKQWEAERAEREEQRKFESARIEAERAEREAERVERVEQREVESARIEAEMRGKQRDQLKKLIGRISWIYSVSKSKYWKPRPSTKKI